MSPGKVSKKLLEYMLSEVPGFKEPVEILEQYVTPPDIAADVVWNAFMRGDIEGKVIVDLGCGTGRLAAASLMLGAKLAVCIDIDFVALKVPRGYVLGSKLSTPLEVLATDVGTTTSVIRGLRNCTVIMNPPFGVKVRGTDLKFVLAAMELCDVIYSLHKNVVRSLQLLKGVAEGKGYTFSVIREYKFPIFWSLERHRRRKYLVDVVLVRFKFSGT